MPFLKNRSSSKSVTGTSLQKRIIFGSTAAVIIPFAITALFLYHKLSGELADQAKEKSVLIAKDLSALLESSLKMELKVVSTIAADKHIADEFYAKDYTAVSDDLVSIFDEIGYDYISIFVTDTSGRVCVDLPESVRFGLDLSDREYFIRAKLGKSSVSGPLLSRGPSSSKWTNAPILITAAPIMRKGQFIGMIAIAHDTTAVNSIMSQIRLGETGYPFVIDRDGLVIIHPKQEYVMTINMYDEPGMSGILEMVRRGKAGAEEYSFRGTKKIAGFAALNMTGWNVIFTQNRNEILKPVNDILASIAIIGAAFVIIVMISIILLSKRISSPVQKFVDILQQFTTYTNEFVLGMDANKKIMFANPAAAQYCGSSIEELIGTEPDFTNTGNVSSEEIWNTLERGIPWMGRITPKTQTDNDPVIAIMIMPVKDNRGSITGYLEFGRDISLELIQEKRIRQAQKIEAIGTLAGGIAHDFNNILTGIFGFIELALLAPDNPQGTVKYLKDLQNAALRARDLVNQILTFSRHSKPELHALAPKLIIKEVIKLIRASTPAEIIIETNLASNTPVMADPVQIHQVIVNLCTNALHAIGNSHGVIRLDLEDIIVDQSFIKDHPGLVSGKHVLIRITDTGSGISTELIDHIFDPLFTTKENGEGTGLGLSVVHGIVSSMNGIITVYSEPGKGSTFNVIIPATDNATAEPDASDTGLLRGCERIMLVDDEGAITESLSNILVSIGYTVTSFSESMLALEAIRTRPDKYDIVITDHSMPRLSGIDFAREIKLLKKSIPVLLMSGFVTRQMEENARQIGIDMIIKKPLSIAKLTGILRKYLDQ